MRSLEAREEDLLVRISLNPSLQVFFFRKAKGLKWFDPLNKEGYFAPNNNPIPLRDAGNEHVTIPFWQATDYLVATAVDLVEAENEEYAIKFMNLVREVTTYTRQHEYHNYRTWWQFSKIINNMPAHLIKIDDLAIFDYWLSDPYETDLVAEELGEKLFPKLVAGGEHSIEIALGILDILFKVRFDEQSGESRPRKQALLRIGTWNADKIIKVVARLSGEKAGLDAAHMWEAKLTVVLDTLTNDTWSSIWRNSIEDQERKGTINDYEELLLVAYRDCLLGLVDYNSKTALDYLHELLNSEYQTLRRIAIYIVDTEFPRLSELANRVVIPKHFKDNLKHELWHFLNNHFQDLNNNLKRQIIRKIKAISVDDEMGNAQEKRTAYERSVWLAAIKDKDEAVDELYQALVNFTKTKPDHPDMAFYTHAGFVQHESPIPTEELMALNINELVIRLNEYISLHINDSGRLLENEGNEGFREVGIEGLVAAIKTVVKARANDFYYNLTEFLNLDLAFVHAILEAYKELWGDKSALPWDDIWPKLLKYCANLVQSNEFWSPENAEPRKASIANRLWVVTSIAELIEEGTKTDEHAFEALLLPEALVILRVLLDRQAGQSFTSGDAVVTAINSPRGHCIEALINHSLRACRLADQQQNEHLSIWKEYEVIYENELMARKDSKYEFPTLITMYLPNFLYMSIDWVIRKLSDIFPYSDDPRWRCSMQGYAYVSAIHPQIYQFLKDNDHFIKALDDDYLKKNVKERVIQNILVAFLSEYESLENPESLISVLLRRGKLEELQYLVWFTTTQEKKKQYQLSSKVEILWPRLLSLVDVASKQGRQLASSLCSWAVFIDNVTDLNRPWLETIAPYADESHNGYHLLEHISRISRAQPLEAQRLWLAMLAKSYVDRPRDAIIEIFTNLVRMGSEGLKRAYEVVDVYNRRGNVEPRLALKAIRENAEN